MADQLTIPAYDDFISQVQGAGQDVGAAREVYFEAYIKPQFADKDVAAARSSFDTHFALPDTSAPSTWDNVKGVAEEGYKGVRRGLNTVQQGALGIASGIAHNYLPDAAGEYMDRQVRENAGEMRSLAPSVTRQTALDSPTNTAKYVAGAVGEMAGNIAPNLIMGPLTRGMSLIPSVAATTFGNAQSEALTRQDVKQATEQLDSWNKNVGAPIPKEGLPVDLSESYKGIDKTQLAVGAGLSTGLELAGLRFMPSAIRNKLEGKEAVDLLNDAVGGVVSRTFKAGGKAAFGEGLTEGLQTYPEKLAEGAGLGEVFSPQTFEEAKDAAASAAVGSFGIGAAGAQFGGSPRQNDTQFSNGIQSEGMTQEDEIAAMRGEVAPKAPPPKSPEALQAEEAAARAAQKDAETAKVQAVQDLVPNAFVPPKPKKGELPDLERMLTYPEFEKEAKKSWQASVPKVDPLQMNQAYTEALKENPTLDYKVFEKAQKAQMQQAHAAERPEPKTEMLRPAYLQYVQMHQAGIRGFNEAYDKLEQELGPRAPDVPPEMVGASSSLIGQAPKGQMDLFGAPTGADMTIPAVPEAPAPETPSTGVQLQLPMDQLRLPAPQSEKLLDLAAKMERGDFGPVHPNAVDALLKAAIEDQSQAEQLNAANAPREPAPAPNLPEMPPAVKPALPLSTLPGATDALQNQGQAPTRQEVSPPPAAQTAPPAPPVKAQAKPKPKNRRAVDPENDDLIVAIRKLGGINVELESDFAGRLKSIPTPKIVGVGNVERTKGAGRSLDDLAEALWELGYLANRDASELYEKLWNAESGRQSLSMDKQADVAQQADNGTDRWIEELERAGSEDEVVQVARSAGADPRFQARMKNDAEYQKAWFAALDYAQEQTAPLEPRQAAAPTQDLMPAPTATDQKTADQLALEARQQETRRKLNATNAPQGGGLFDMDNRQNEMDLGDPNATSRSQGAAGAVPGAQGGVLPVAGEEQPVAGGPSGNPGGLDRPGADRPAESTAVTETAGGMGEPGAVSQEALASERSSGPVVRKPTEREKSLTTSSSQVAADIGGLTYLVNPKFNKTPSGRSIAVVESGKLNDLNTFNDGLVHADIRAGDARHLNRDTLSKGDQQWDQRVPEPLREPLLDIAEASTPEAHAEAISRFNAAVESVSRQQQADPQYSQGSTPQQGTTPEAITGILGESPRVVVHQTLADAEKATGRTLKGNAKAFVLNGKAHFIADRIAPGSELGVFLHELGSHLGMERVLSKEQIARLAKQVEQWAKSGQGIEQAAAEAAVRRAGGNPSETVAYFVEEAANRGIDPTKTNMKSPVGRWLGQVWRAIKESLVKWGFRDVGKLSPQDVVNFAYGAAKLEMKRSQPRQVESPEFKKWFGGSKIVGRNGQPLVMYHGGRPGIDVFQPNMRNDGIELYAMFFSPSQKAANAYAGRRSDSQVYPVFLNVRNPKYVTDPIDLQVTSKAKLQELIDAGYDGIVYPGRSTKSGLWRREKIDPYSAEVAVLNPNQIKSAIGNNGEFDPTNPDIRYSLQDDAAQKAKAWSEDALGAAMDAKTEGLEAFKLLLNPHQVADLNPQYPSAATYADAVDAMQAAAGEYQQRIGVLTERMENLPKEELAKLSDLMTKSTLTDIHVDKPFDDAANAHLDPEKNDDKLHAQLAERYQALSPESQAIYSEMRDHFADMWERRFNAVQDLATRMGVEGQAATKLNSEIAQLRRKVKGPYFPLMREGKYVVTWKSQELLDAEKAKDMPLVDQLKGSAADYWVRFTDSESEAKKLSTNRPEKMGEGFGTYKLRTESSREVSGAGAEFVAKLETTLRDRIPDKETGDVAVTALKQVFLETLPDLSVMKRTMMRRGVAGVRSEDMVRAIAKAGVADAHYLARLAHADKITSALQALRLEDANPKSGEEVDTTEPGTPRGGIGRVYNLIAKDYRGTMLRPANGLASWMAGKLVEGSYLHSLALDTGNLIANAMQPTLTVWPMLGGRHGFQRSYLEMARGLKDAMKIVRAVNYNLDIEKITNENGEQDALKKLRDMGKIELSMSRDLASAGRGESLQYDRMRKFLAAPAHYVETVTRISSVLAAYRMELARARRDEQGTSEDSRRMKAIDYAARISREALVDFTPGGAPIVMKGNQQAIAKVAMQYKRFAISMLYLYGKTARDAFKASDMGAKKEAQKTLAAMLFTQFTIAGGLAGLPTALPAQLLASLWPTDDEDESAEEKLNRLADTLAGGNPQLSMAMRKGPLSALTGADLSRKMGLSDLLVLNSGQITEPLKPNEKPSTRIIKVAAPSLAFVDRMYDGMTAASNGDLVDAAVKFLPRSIISDVILARRAAEEGMTSKDRTGKVSPLEYQANEIISKALGIPPLLETLKWEASDAATARDKGKADRRERLLDQWVIAARKDDAEGKARAQANIDEYNASLPEGFKGYKIKKGDQFSRKQSARKGEKSLTETGIKKTKRNKGWVGELDMYKPLR